MKRLGIVENLSYDGTVLVRSEFAPPLGAPVMDKREKHLGSVVKVFGPVQQPFTAIRPAQAPALGLVGTDVYMQERTPHAQQKDRGNRRSH